MTSNSRLPLEADCKLLFIHLYAAETEYLKLLHPCNLYAEDSKKGKMNKAYDIGVFDAHCHPTDIADSIKQIARMKAKVLTVMSTRSQDQDLVADAARKYPISSKDQLAHTSGAKHVVPAFGWHPWFSHQMYIDTNVEDVGQGMAKVDATEHYRSVLTPAPDEDFIKTLMPPMSFSLYLKETEQRLQRFPLALVGEIGVDRGFRLPEGPSSMTGDVSRKTGGDEGTYTPGSREGRPLTPYKVNMDHQKKILRMQLELAAKCQRPVSVHSVQAHGVVFEVLQGLWKDHMKPSKREMKKKRDAEGAIEHDEEETQNDDSVTVKTIPYPPRICMHSYSGPQDSLKPFLDPKIPADMFFSFSECINFGNSSSKAVEVIKAIPEDRILIESDLHCAGYVMDQLLEKILKRVCEIKDWNLEEGAKILRTNWERFVFGP